MLSARPGSLVSPSVIVTIDLISTGFYNRPAVFNVLNGVVNRGWIGPFDVSPIGFTVKSLSDGTHSTRKLYCNYLTYH